MIFNRRRRGTREIESSWQLSSLHKYKQQTQEESRLRGSLCVCRVSLPPPPPSPYRIVASPKSGKGAQDTATEGDGGGGGECCGEILHRFLLLTVDGEEEEEEQKQQDRKVESGRRVQVYQFSSFNSVLQHQWTQWPRENA